ncbi:hypothetical protein [Candidatus Nanosynbacter sp. TM7-053]|uniref:hypothetical protein n=1 Tax=Candidatus Nanosynbacter sp. TM7-053 TaxID=2902634 RepID=UPI001CB15FC5|nr:hypothetical protein [Candidatus Nanosynbacter sp. TM7-053]MBF1033515.1 hypothetical protein [Candidatus Nanosynbacter sp.]MCJ1965922.1 hypothetical protein [Candidatus Nanosynbacter sp. TM7-053]
MSTAVLTVAISVTLIAGLLAFTIVSLYRHRLSTAALSAAGLFATIHITFVALAWSELAIAYLDAPLTVQRWEVAWPPISSLSTMIYDAPAWAAIISFMMSVVLGAIEWKRRRAAEKEMAAFLKYLFGGNEDTKPEKSEED